MKSLYVFLIATIFILPTNSHASDDFWGQTGHRVVGKIADNYLKGKAKREVRRLLKRKSLAFVSTFADEIKSDKRYNKFYTWHYINMPLDSNYEDSKKNPKGDLVTGIAYCTKIIKDDKSTDDDKSFYLKLLIHLIGDLHQPMHIGKKEDKGGNMFQVQWFGKGSNLHKVWDENMIDSYKMSYSDLADNAENLSKKQIEVIEKGSIIDWVNEVHRITVKVYKSAKTGENLRYKYSYNNFDIVRTQLQKGGIRLAKVLNDIFD